MESTLVAAIPRDPAANVDGTVEKLIELTTTAARRARADDPRALGDHIWQVWTSVLDTAGRTPPAQQKTLVRFVLELRQKPLADPDSGEPLKHQDGSIWADLPTLGWVARDVWNFDVLDLRASQEDLERWENQSAFLAQLTGLVEAGQDSRADFSLFALWAFRTAFETATDRPSVAAVRLASQWLIYAGDKLFQNAKQEKSFPQRSGAEGDRLGAKGWTGFNLERWTVWKDGLDAARADLADEGSRSLLTEAGAAMEKAMAASA
ncbi:hypothetical protein GQ53DRAFT_746313 [Thozetella sp. PMI_491]|nr:hypothetical protein GQ53DRAFT_746313 [Thozetella sp. PMI_491]